GRVFVGGSGSGGVGWKSGGEGFYIVSPCVSKGLSWSLPISLKLSGFNKHGPSCYNRVESSDDNEDLDDEQMFDVNNLQGEEVLVQEDVASEVNAASILTTDSAAATMTVDEVTLAQALIEIKSTKPKSKGIVLQEPSESRTTTTISLKKSQDKGKGIMVEEHVKLKKKDQIMLNEEVALNLKAKLQAEFDKEQRLASEKTQQEEEANIALIETNDDV
nr:hypothetical protein [Tanacetum cinerariifolium]